jgi:cytoskeleton protein RodZ
VTVPARSSEQPVERRAPGNFAAVGQKVRQVREARSLTIDQASVATRIRAHYLRAIESGDFGALPSAAQARGFLRAYAGFLNQDADQLLAMLDEPPASARVEAQTASPATAETPSAGEGGDLSASIDPTPTKPLASRRPASPPAPPDPASQVFVEVGASLHRQRELLGLSLEDVEQHTHLRLHYLQALENGNLEGLPSPVQGRGMLNNYATFLGLDPEPLLLRFAEGLQMRLAARQNARTPAQEKAGRRAAAERSRRPLPAPLRRLLSGDVLIGGTLAIFLVIFVVWGATRIFILSSSGSQTATAPSIADVLLATATPTQTLTPLPPSATPPPTLPFAPPVTAIGGTPGPGNGGPPQTGGAEGASAVQIYINVYQRAWLRATVDGKIEYEGRVLPGTPLAYNGDKQVEILTSNGLALQPYLNGIDQGRMGGLGEVVNRVYTRLGVLNPTPTITPTPLPQPTGGAPQLPAGTPQTTAPSLP